VIKKYEYINTYLLDWRLIMDKQLSLLYFSATGSTAKIVKRISDSIGKIENEYDITLSGNRQVELTFDSNDLVIVGVPVYAGRVPSFLSNYFSKVKGNNTKVIIIVVYGNRDYDDALLELKDIFERNGFIGIAGGTFIGEHSYTTKLATGRPDVTDLNFAVEFGRKIREKLNDGTERNDLIVKGKFPYKEKKPVQLIAPVTTDNCIECGICANHCPMEAINFSNYKAIDASKCIKCCSCIKKCPVAAKSINDETFIKFTQGLIDNFSSVRHEPEFFI
jgi:ferredoxin